MTFAIRIFAGAAMMGKAPTRDWPNPTRATVRLPDGEELQKLSELLTKIPGEGAVPEDVAHLVGALDDAMVYLNAGPDGQ
jgi:hypothetical protein